MPSLRTLVELVRGPAALSVPGDVVTGAAAARRLCPRTAGLAAASVCLYWAGMAANDWADRRRDAVERPERPIPSGRVTPAQAVGLAAGLTAAGVGLAALAGGRRAVAVALPLAAAVWTYDLAAKDTAAGPPVMAACRGLDVLLGAGIDRWRRALPATLTVAAHTYTVTVLSRREVGGGDPWLPAATAAATAGVALAAATPGPARRRLVPAALAGWYAARYGHAQIRAVAVPSAERIRTAVGAGIVGLPRLQGALTARAGAPAVGALVAAGAVLAGRLARRVSPT